MSVTVIDWIAAQEEGRRRFLWAIGARAVTDMPILLEQGCAGLSRHRFAGRTRQGLIAIVEVWCNHPAVIAAMREVARERAAIGYCVAFLPTRFSTRAVGKRQPLLVVPPGSDVDPHEIFAALIAANFVGVTGPS